jgi:hypothetical protein
MAIEAEELSAITRGIRNAGMETAGEFRQAANASNANLSRIVKDISTTFKSQREDIADLHNVLEEMVSESQQTGNKIDSLNSLFRESLEIQNSMRTEISNVTRNTRTLSGDIESLNRNIMNTSSSGLLGSITNLSSDFAKQLATLGIGAAVAGGGMAALSTAGGGGAIGPGVGESGSSSEAMSFFQSKGWSKEQAAGIVGNLQVESGKSLRTNAVGDNGQAYGIAQWHPDRQAKFQQVMGIPIRQSNFKQQLEFVQWELMNTEKRAGQMLKSASTAIEAARAIDYGYERSTHQHLGQRMANAAALAKSSPQDNKTTSTPSGGTTPTSTPTATPVSTPEVIPSANDPRTERIGKEGGHGPISGVAHEGHGHGEQVGASLPAGDVVALGHALEKMGMRISEHPQFGGVKPVHKGKAHYEGRAIDINFGEGNVEARDPVMGAKFDQLAEQLTRLGYKVYWRESGPYAAAGHNNHLHAEIPKGGAPSVPDTYQVAGTPEQRALQGATPAVGTTTSMAPPAASPMAAAEPVAQAPISSGISAPPAGANMMGQMMGMMPGMMGGGIGGIVGMLLPMITSAIQSELVSTPSMPALNAQMLNQAAVTSQATEQTIQEAQGSFFNPQVNVEPNRMTATNQSGFAYNMPGDIEWPDWASMLGGNHYEEMKNYKKNMSWG